MKTWLCVSMLIYIFTSTAAFSADVRIIEPNQNIMSCDFLLEGEIGKNTHLELTQLVQLWTSNEADAKVSAYLSGFSAPRLCLNSPGGSYLGGVDLAALLQELGVATAVSKGAVCESACAIAFMAGSRHHDDGVEPTPDRALHPEARLGFHAPGLEIPDGQYHKQQVEAAYEIALSAVSKLLQLRAQTYFQMPESLVSKMLSTPPSQMYYVETVQDAFRYGIDIPHDSFPNTNIEHIGVNLCDNAVSWTKDREIITSEIWVDDSEVEDGYIISAGAGFGGYVKCRAFCFSDGCTAGSGSSGHYEPIHSLSLAATYHPETLLKELSEQQSMTFSEYEKRLKMMSVSLAQDKPTCNLSYQEVGVTNVNEFTNLRDRAGIGNRIIAEVPLGATVLQIDPGSYWTSDRCVAGCKGDYEQINKCISDNEVWLEVEYDGRRGFLSRKFLE